ncbi:hypothetical protein IX324_002901 [Bacteroides pyogenes]|nr:hypothetical protein [Bacteroides pyogenes]
MDLMATFIPLILRKQCVNKLFQLGGGVSFTRNSKIRNSLKFNKNSDNKLLGNIILSFSQAGGRRFKPRLVHEENQALTMTL